MTTNSFARKVAHVITSPFNQNLTAIFVGGTGSGKSYAAISLATAVSEEVSRIKGGRPSDYFDLTKNMSVIDIMQFFEVLDSAKKWNTVVLDDAGIGVNARKFQDAINITINNITQTYRTLNLFTILTVPELFFVDKLIRHLVDFYIEMEGVVVGTDDLSRGRLFEVQRKSRLGSSGKLFYVYPRGHQQKMVGITFTKPSSEICVAYEKLRSEGAEKYRKESIEAIKDGKGKVAEKKAGAPMKKDKFDEVETLRKYGIPVGVACKKVGMSVGWYDRLRQQREA